MSLLRLLHPREDEKGSNNNKPDVHYQIIYIKGRMQEYDKTLNNLEQIYQLKVYTL